MFVVFLIAHRDGEFKDTSIIRGVEETFVIPPRNRPTGVMVVGIYTTKEEAEKKKKEILE